jgi:hypothetical protein
MAKIELTDEDGARGSNERFDSQPATISRRYTAASTSLTQAEEGYDDDSEYYTTDEEEEADPTNRWALARLLPSCSLVNWSSLTRLGTVLGNAVWIVMTSLVLTCLPVLYAYDREKNYEAYEAEQQRFTSPPTAANTDSSSDKKQK